MEFHKFSNDSLAERFHHQGNRIASKSGKSGKPSIDSQSIHRNRRNRTTAGITKNEFFILQGTENPALVYGIDPEEVFKSSGN